MKEASTSLFIAKFRGSRAPSASSVPTSCVIHFPGIPVFAVKSKVPREVDAFGEVSLDATDHHQERRMVEKQKTRFLTRCCLDD